MRKLILVSLTILLLCCAVPTDLQAQQPTPTPGPLTFYYDYSVFPGKEEDLNTLIRTVGAPVRDKLMAEGVIMAWGVETPIMRYPGGTTHLIWFTVANWAGVEKVLNGMEARLAQLAREEAQPGRGRPRGAMTTAELSRAVFDGTKTRDWLTRDIVAGFGPPPAAGVLPFTRYNFIKVKPGKGADYRRTWEKYNKPVFDKLVADGVVLGYGLAAEEVKTDGNWTHFVWIATATMAAGDRIGPAFAADRARRSEKDRNQITEDFLDATEPDKARSMVTRARIFKIAPQR
ncbi:MAG TPA: hypothetical protein VEW46_10830 [Pyrinomonadaceae bacterium]|nr:hypothetical protein [Pyrinomonadaceae bacterium]